MNAKYPGISTVIHGNGAVAEVMGHVCGGVIGYPITPSTEISEIYEAFRSGGGCNVWGKHPFFFEPEGEHSAQSGALGAAMTGGKFVSNASSSQGILYALESHYVTVGKKVGGFVLQVAARVVSKHSLNVMAGHDDVYALLQSGYTILFGSNPQEAADLAAISYKVSATSLIPVANAMDGFATSHMMCETLMPEPALLREFLGDPSGRIKVSDGGAGDALRRQGPRLPAQAIYRQTSGRLRPRRPPGREVISRCQRGRGREGQCKASWWPRRSAGSLRSCAASGGGNGSMRSRRAPVSSFRRWSTSTIPASPAACRTNPTSRPARLTIARTSSTRCRSSYARQWRSTPSLRAASTSRSRRSCATMPKPWSSASAL